MKTSNSPLNMTSVRNDFPILKQLNRGKKLVYLDSAASAQKPHQVVNAISHFYLHDYANIHRGIYELSARATKQYEATREHIKQFLNTPVDGDVILTHGTTDGINLVANVFSYLLSAGDEIILSEMEHHSNIVPWYLLTERLGIVLKIVPVHDDGSIDLDVYQQLFSARTRLVAVSHVSNAMGTINPVREMILTAKEHEVPVLVDGAQAVPHLPVDLSMLDCDFYAFSGHKLYGPTGIGALYIKNKWLHQLPPYQGGGDMIETVDFDLVTYAKGVQKFEAGTPHIAGAIGLSAAIKYLNQYGMDNIFDHEQQLLQYAELQLMQLPGLKIIGTTKPKVGVISFVIDGIHPHDIGTVLDSEGIAVRAGHHCAMPLMKRFNVPATVRASFGIFNQVQD
ncbi:MAG: cysteine desulfurase, partial [Gammaproteobacteria bacterium]|nr:cysteine desulfurase [Gammaproteobacteria bacterium]